MQEVIGFDAGSKTEFTNNSLNSPKIGKLNIDTLIIPQGLSIHEKTQTKKSRDTDPLIQTQKMHTKSGATVPLTL